MKNLPPFYPVTASPGPLAGLKVIELGHYGSAPRCTMMLADLGADVIKIESPSGDIYRRLPPFQDGESHYFMSINRNKCSAVQPASCERAETGSRAGGGAHRGNFSGDPAWKRGRSHEVNGPMGIELFNVTTGRVKDVVVENVFGGMKNHEL